MEGKDLVNFIKENKLMDKQIQVVYGIYHWGEFSENLCNIRGIISDKNERTILDLGLLNKNLIKEELDDEIEK